MKRSTIKLAGLVAVGLVIGGTAAAVTETQTARTNSTSSVSELPLVGSAADTAGLGQLVPQLPMAGLPTDQLSTQTAPQAPGSPGPATPKLDLPISSLPAAANVGGVNSSNPTGMLDQVTMGLPTDQLTGGLPTNQVLGGVTELLGNLPLDGTGLLGN